jgi:hypothetical protein
MQGRSKTSSRAELCTNMSFLDFCSALRVSMSWKIMEDDIYQCYRSRIFGGLLCNFLADMAWRQTAKTSPSNLSGSSQEGESHPVLCKI